MHEKDIEFAKTREEAVDRVTATRSRTSNIRRFNVVRKIERAGRKTYWAPVGSLTLFEDPDPTQTGGRLLLNILGEELHVFPQNEKDTRHGEQG